MRPLTMPGDDRDQTSLMSQDEPDRLFSAADGAHAPFVFDDRVARVFTDMVRRSVPGYENMVALTGLLGAPYLRPGSRCYDLGCSLGAVTRALLDAAPACPCDIVAVDSSPAMIAGLADRLAGCPGAERVSPVCADLDCVAIADASLVVLNLTLQFVAPERRLALLTRVRAGLRPGGALILAEKVRGADDLEERLLVDLHHGFKQAMGYSRLEIARKRAALEQVLVPDTVAVHEGRLRQAGFSQPLRWFQCLNFVAWLAWT